MEWLWRCAQVDELGLGRLRLVGIGIPLPGPRQEAQCEAVGDIAIGVAVRVSLSLGEAAERDQVALEFKSGLLGQLVDGCPGKAPTRLRGAGREDACPSSVRLVSRTR